MLGLHGDTVAALESNPQLKVDASTTLAYFAKQSEGVTKVLVEPIGFVADHLEIYWDIDIEAREKAVQLGLELDRTESLNDDPAFIRVLAGVVQQQPAYPPAVPAP